MDLEKSLLFKYENVKCEFRTIYEDDVTKEYVDGLNDQKEYIENREAYDSYKGIAEHMYIIEN